MRSGTLLSLVNHYPCDNYTTRTKEHSSEGRGGTWPRSAKHVSHLESNLFLFLPQKANDLNTPYKRLLSSPWCCGTNNRSLSSDLWKCSLICSICTGLAKPVTFGTFVLLTSKLSILSERQRVKCGKRYFWSSQALFPCWLENSEFLEELKPHCLASSAGRAACKKPIKLYCGCSSEGSEAEAGWST